MRPSISRNRYTTIHSSALLLLTAFPASSLFGCSGGASTADSGGPGVVDPSGVAPGTGVNGVNGLDPATGANAVDPAAGASGAGEGAPTATTPGPAPVAPGGPGQAPLRRLNNAEYANTVGDLFGTSVPAVPLPPEGRTAGFDTLDTALAVSQIHVEAYLDAADAIIADLFAADPGNLTAGWCNYQTADDAANVNCARDITASFAELAWRRPLSAWPDGTAVTPYQDLLLAEGALASFPLETRLQTALSAVLASPRFLYRVEFADEQGALDSASLASRLSYFLWSSAPDETLLQSDLLDRAALAGQAQRLQGDPRFERFVQRFPDLWLDLGTLAGLERDPEVYPGYSPELGEKMGVETREYLRRFIMDPNVPFAQLILDPAPVPSDPDLQALYGSSPRQGLLTQAAILAVTGVSDRTSAVRRGLWVLESLLCSPPPPPPADVIAALAEDNTFDPTLTERVRLAQHRENPSCATCHNLMDPIGLGLENYDSIGAYRTTDGGGNSIDPSGQLLGGGAFTDAMGLIQLVGQDPRLSTCLVQQLLTYGVGREFKVNGGDNALIAVVQAAAGGSAMSFASALTAVVSSDGFIRRADGEVQ